MEVIQTRQFAKTVKKLHPPEKKALDAAVRAIMKDPALGEMKKGDLAGIRVHKFRNGTLITLLAYHYDEAADTLTLLALGSHENFYRDLKK